ncbi:hypothetical protein PR048_029931 [Dryococelus australis]|uniref:Uncharacterized protein n=1 Tax=Dryococelus australis TaxID=614101 RepID=A0ABQ9G7J2_9NEOP|nr:hypothetical protein PR048_029931 [Dryococelus australis]
MSLPTGSHCDCGQVTALCERLQITETLRYWCSKPVTPPTTCEGTNKKRRRQTRVGVDEKCDEDSEPQDRAQSAARFDGSRYARRNSHLEWGPGLAHWLERSSITKERRLLSSGQRTKKTWRWLCPAVVNRLLESASDNINKVGTFKLDCNDSGVRRSSTDRVVLAALVAERLGGAWRRLVADVESCLLCQLPQQRPGGGVRLANSAAAAARVAVELCARAAAAAAFRRRLAVVQWSDYLLPTHANRVRSLAVLLPDFRTWESCRVMPLVSGFSRGSPVPSPPLLSSVTPCSPHFILINSQDLDAGGTGNKEAVCKKRLRYALGGEVRNHWVKITSSAVGRNGIRDLHNEQQMEASNIFQHLHLFWNSSIRFGATVAERLARSPPTKANRVQSPDVRKWDRAGRCRWSAGFLGDLPFPLPLHSSPAPYSTSITLIGSQDLAVNSRPYLSRSSIRFMRRPPGMLYALELCSDWSIVKAGVEPATDKGQVLLLNFGMKSCHSRQHML